MAKFTGTGTQDKKKVALAAGLGVAVLALAVHTLFMSSTPAPVVPPPSPYAPVRNVVHHQPRPTGDEAAEESAESTAVSSLDPTLHPGLMRATENYLYTGTGRNIFAVDGAPIQSTAMPHIEKVRAPIRPVMTAAAAGPPGPPPINLRFFGYTSHHNGKRQAFLKQGDNIFVASEGDVVAHRYKVVSIAPSTIQVEDLPYNDTQSLPLTLN